MCYPAETHPGNPSNPDLGSSPSRSFLVEGFHDLAPLSPVPHPHTSSPSQGSLCVPLCGYMTLPTFNGTIYMYCMLTPMTLSVYNVYVIVSACVLSLANVSVCVSPPVWVLLSECVCPLYMYSVQQLWPSHMTLCLLIMKSKHSSYVRMVDAFFFDILG